MPNISHPASLRRRPVSRPIAGVAALGLTLVISACAPGSLYGSREAGYELNIDGQLGVPTRNNIGFHTGELQYGEILAERFANEVPTTINFAFNSATLDDGARAILRQQARFIRHFPEVRFSVYGHTDLVGSDAYNQRLGLRRARAAVDFLVSQGIERSRLDALVSLGETQPIVATEGQEPRNRRTVTEVTGFVQSHPSVMDGEYARIIYRAYVGTGQE